ncbi:MAG: hypothetical protein K2X56_18615 [Mycobacterium pseudokansasii]|uniref:Uncharacterized protein n=1 Tax=Mycobacterium pseudokansasii TaxID=2341080 RepID=A0A498R0H5_9MYCO|nr:hypothetical protein [Mycobacterium pseudokansasii]MBY0390040.1 hypothetical protein [Mycobacterium pseudokansasii]VBA55060.1 hypothetical protein LAUMK142_04940 [Mycobacterium pseudokansasii]
MSLAVFEDVARAHFCNPPATWQITPSHDDGWWNVVDNHGAVLDRCPSKARAEQCRCNGPAATRWYQRTDWYLGYDPHGRSLTGSQRLIIADITELIAAASHAFRQARTVRPARFVDQGADDDRIWAVALLPTGRYQVHGDYFHTYDATELDFLDQEAITDLAADLRDLLDGERQGCAL